MTDLTDLTERLDAIQKRASEHGPCSAEVCGSRICRTERDRAFLLALARKQQAAFEAVTARLDEWDSYKPWPDAEETQVWYSAGKRHASEAVRALITEAMEAKP